MEPIIDYRDVQINRDSLIALKHATLRVEPGEFVYLIGKVGSGKSSLLKSFYADIPVASGEAFVMDYDLRNIKKSQIPYLRRKIGIVFQDFRLLSDRSARDNLSFVLRATGWKDKNAINERIDEVLTSVGMLNKHYKHPYELSGGEQQRLVIARALLNNPPLLLADEPTGNLDPATGESIVSHLHEIARNGTAVVMATHNMSLVEQFPARVVTCSGRTLIHN
ncbi:MAG: ATP-binding cassette domain-containing protein [Muribaculaceae bacterium]|nr:ATP-binding cassette domain-containing protein [Muribaculaceae bacterium]